MPPPPWVSVAAFLAEEESRGPREVSVRGSELRSHEQYDLDILTLLSLLQRHGGSALRRVACIPSSRLCLFRKGDRLVVRSGSTCPRRAAQPAIDVRGGVAITGLHSRIELWLPDGFHESLAACARRRSQSP